VRGADAETTAVSGWRLIFSARAILVKRFRARARKVSCGAGIAPASSDDLEKSALSRVREAWFLEYEKRENLGQWVNPRSFKRSWKGFR